MVELILTADKKEFPGFDKLVLDAEKAMKEKIYEIKNDIKNKQAEKKNS
jgi:hypothetical protein